MSLNAYRHVLRSIRIAFQGDFRLLSAARQEARAKFSESRALVPGSEEAVKGVEHAESVAVLLRQNVVQGTQDTEEGRFRLRIHEDTERGDNDSVKQASKFKGRTGTFEKCGS